jgi:hypothetical protein
MDIKRTHVLQWDWTMCSKYVSHCTLIGSYNQEGLCKHLKRKMVFTFPFYKINCISTPNRRLEFTIWVICKCCSMRQFPIQSNIHNCTWGLDVPTIGSLCLHQSMWPYCGHFLLYRQYLTLEMQRECKPSPKLRWKKLHEVKVRHYFSLK